MSILIFSLSNFASFVLWIFGWEPLPKEFKETFLATKKKIVIYPHTTYFDFPILAIYGLTHWNDYNKNIYVVMKPQLAAGWCKDFFSRFNCIPAPPKGEKGNGFVEKTVAMFRDKEEYSIVISPEGTTSKQEWRSGYYYLAKELNCPIMVIGANYCYHVPVISKDLVYPEDDLPVVQGTLKTIMGNIPTLHPECSVVKPRYDIRSNPSSLIDLDAFVFRGIIPGLVFLGSWNYFFSLLAITIFYCKHVL